MNKKGIEFISFIVMLPIFMMVLLVALIIGNELYEVYQEGDYQGDVIEILQITSGGWGSSDKALVELNTNKQILVTENIHCLQVGKQIEYLEVEWFPKVMFSVQEVYRVRC